MESNSSSSASASASSGLTDTSTGTSKRASMNTAVPWSVALLSGAMAGTTVDVCLYPIDTVKTRMQSSVGFWKSGGFRGIYNGVSAAFIGSAPGAALFFTTYESTKPLFHKLSQTFFKSEKKSYFEQDENEQISQKAEYSSDQDQDDGGVNSNPLAHMMAASAGEVAACLVRVPTEVVKQRMQTNMGQPGYRTLPESFRTVLHSSRGGISGFYVGYTTTVFREIPFSFIQFPIWERLKLRMSEYLFDKGINESAQLKPYQGALCGSVAGGTAAALTTPLDVIKTRLMLGTDKEGKAYKGFADVVTRIHREEGARALFKGLPPRVMWIFIGGFFFFGAYEQSKQILMM